MTGGKGGRFKKKVLGKLDSLYGGGGGENFLPQIVSRISFR